MRGEGEGQGGNSPKKVRWRKLGERQGREQKQDLEWGHGEELPSPIQTSS